MPKTIRTMIVPMAPPELSDGAGVFTIVVIVVILQIIIVLVKYQQDVYTGNMLILILFLVIGAVMAYLAQNNLMPVTLRLGTYIFPGIPLFYIIIGSLLTGLGLAYLIYMVSSIIATYSAHRKDNTIKQGKSDIVDLTKRIHQLEIENAKLKGPIDENAL